MYRSRLREKPESRSVEVIGSDADSSESEGEDEELFSAESTEDEQEELEDEESSEDEEEHDTFSNIFTAPDGTQWTVEPPDEPMDPWRSQAHDFGDGPVNGAENEDLTIRQHFELFFPPNLIADICKWTNKYGSHLAQKWNQRNPNKTPRTWEATNEKEIYALIGLVLLSGIEKARKKPWKELWAKSESIRCPPFVATMSQKRFSSLMAALRFDDTVERHAKRFKRGGPDAASSSSCPTSRTEPIQDLFEKVIANFKKFYRPAAKLCVDEQIIKFKGRCSFRVYTPEKPGKYGIKVWALVDNASGYLLNMKIYEGKRGQPQVGLARQVVLDLVDDYRDTGRGIVADNYFSSYRLVSDLLERKFTFCGTLRKDRREVPAAMRNVRLLARPDAFLFEHQKQVTLLRHMHRPQKFALLISSTHYSDEMVQIETSRGTKIIPAIINYYNCNKGGVDVADYKISIYTGQFPSRRWPVKVFIHCIDCSAINAFITWTKTHASWRQGAGRSKRRLFIRDLAYELIKPQIIERAATTSSLQSYVVSAMANMGVDYKTLAAPRPVTTSSTATNRPSRCIFCTKSRTRSRSHCKHCNRAICEEHTTKLCPQCSPESSETTEETDTHEMDAPE